jgi:hypothetical protein
VRREPEVVAQHQCFDGRTARQRVDSQALAHLRRGGLDPQNVILDPADQTAADPMRVLVVAGGRVLGLDDVQVELDVAVSLDEAVEERLRVDLRLCLLARALLRGSGLRSGERRRGGNQARQDSRLTAPPHGRALCPAAARVRKALPGIAPKKDENSTVTNRGRSRG